MRVLIKFLDEVQYLLKKEMLGIALNWRCTKSIATFLCLSFGQVNVSSMLE